MRPASLLILVAVVAASAASGPAQAKTKKKKPVPSPTATPAPLLIPDPAFVEAPPSTAKKVHSVEASIFATYKPTLAGITATRPDEKGGTSSGSAFVVHPSGLLITNNHVVAGASEITLRFSEGKILIARLAGADPSLDLAVLRVDSAEPLIPATLGNSDLLEEGDPVLALGNPLGLGSTITRGIISGKERRIDVGAVGAAGSATTYLQTDAAINPGSSGGPLVDYDGAVIGVTSATVPFARGVAFAIPINVVKKALPEMLRNAGTGRVFLGLTLGAATPSGAEVLSVRPGGPGDRAGMKTGDMITSLRGRSISSDADVAEAIRDMAVHETVRLLYMRRGRVALAELTVAEVPVVEPNTEAVLLGGATLAEFGPSSAASERSGQSTGVMFASVPSGSRAEKAGVLPGDIVVVFGIDNVQTLDDVRILMDRKEEAQAFRLYLKRGEKSFTAIVPR